MLSDGVVMTLVWYVRIGLSDRTRQSSLEEQMESHSAGRMLLFIHAKSMKQR